MNDASRTGTPVPGKTSTWEEIRAWRKATREELIRQRLAQGADERHRRGAIIVDRLLELPEIASAAVLGIYWPIRGEIDVRRVAERNIEAGGQVALPVVVEKGAPLEFWRWHPDAPLTRGLWNIPVPRDREPVTPDVLIVPLVGFDSACYRLGYGGGYYDRTLAAAKSRPLTVAITYANAQLASIYPQPHDIPMNRIVTDEIMLP